MRSRARMCRTRSRARVPHAHAGTPCIFWDHLFPEQGIQAGRGNRSLDNLKKERALKNLRRAVLDLVALRKRHDIHARWAHAVPKCRGFCLGATALGGQRSAGWGGCWGAAAGGCVAVLHPAARPCTGCGRAQHEHTRCRLPACPRRSKVKILQASDDVYAACIDNKVGVTGWTHTTHASTHAKGALCMRALSHGRCFLPCHLRRSS